MDQQATSPWIFNSSAIEYDVPLKFYPTTRNDGTPTYISHYRKIVVFSHDSRLYPIIRLHQLEGVTLRVNVEFLSRSTQGGYAVATPINHQNWQSSIIEHDADAYQQAPIIMIDGQNFLRTLWKIDSQASAYDVIDNMVSNFTKSPKIIRLYICPQTLYDIRIQFEDLDRRLSQKNSLPIKIIELQAKRVNTGGNSYKTKSDVDPLFIKDLGIILERYDDPHETLVLFNGDSDCIPVCEDWLGYSNDPFCQVNRGRLLVVASASRERHLSALSPQLKELCNDPNAQVVEIADLI